ncbi:hypothetical protein BDR07DRAFT_1414826 [Suillus spraguei]|nr:hypothetical protein BDR07DRAFT_1414826 [Suillus spraguei]
MGHMTQTTLQRCHACESGEQEGGQQEWQCDCDCFKEGFAVGRSEGKSSRKDDNRGRRGIGRSWMSVTLGDQVVAIGDKNATMTTEETEIEMTGRDDMIVKGTATGIWTKGSEIVMLMNVVTESGDYSGRERCGDREDGADETGHCRRSMLHLFIVICCAEYSERRLLGLGSI